MIIQNPYNAKIFKSDKSLSLTIEGFELCREQYPDYYTLVYKELRPIDILNLAKSMETPYFIDSKKIFHYHEMIDTASNIYRDDISNLLRSFAE